MQCAFMNRALSSSYPASQNATAEAMTRVRPHVDAIWQVSVQDARDPEHSWIIGVELCGAPFVLRRHGASFLRYWTYFLHIYMPKADLTLGISGVNFIALV